MDLLYSTYYFSFYNHLILDTDKCMELLFFSPLDWPPELRLP